MSEYKVEITKLLMQLQEKAEKVNPDAKHNQGRTIGEAYFWDEVVKFAQGKSKQAWLQMSSQGIELEDLETPEPGDHAIGVTPSFTVNCKVSNPRKAFNADELSRLLNKSKFKVPVPVAKEFIEKAKIEGKSTKTYSIAERV